MQRYEKSVTLGLIDTVDMKTGTLKKSSLAALLALAAVFLNVSCEKHGQGDNDPQHVRKVMLLYADGYNNLPEYMADDIRDLAGMAPKNYLRDRFSVLVFQHFSSNREYDIPTKSFLLELYRDNDGNAMTDTVKVYPDTMISSSVEGLYQVLSDVRKLYPASEYGLIYSSHGTGWVPEEYYDSYDPEIYVVAGGDAHHVTGRIDLLSDPVFKSLGCQAYYQGSRLRTREIDVRRLQDAFPMHMKYIIFDACLMGGVETAFQLRSVADKIIFSAVEVPAGGFDYKNLPNRVLYPVIPDYNAVCDDFLLMHKTGTAALVDCECMNGLAAACGELFSKYAGAIAALERSDVQEFFRGEHPWYFDLRDILVKAGVTEQELAGFDKALAACVKHKVCSDSFYSIKLNTYCGLSMYLPSEGNSELDEFYKGYDWNAVTTLVK